MEIPNYRLIKRIGRGAFGEVWLAEEVLTRIFRAVKIIPGAGSAHQRVELDGVRQYQQRSRGHPHLVQVLTVGEAADAFYYVMEAADNGLGSRMASPEDYEPATLAGALVRAERLPIDTALDHLLAMLEGVDHLHRSGLSHRDLKPANVLFVDGVVKLADVGLATSGAGGSVGTPGYRTPEGTPDDLYAVGVMLYEMITGQSPASFPELPADLDRTHDPHRLKEVLRLIDRACHPEAPQRFGSVSEFLQAAAPVGRPRRIGKGQKVLTAVGAIVVVVTAVLVGQGLTRPDASVDPVVLEWSHFRFVADPVLGQWRTFPQEGPALRSRLKLDQAPDGLRQKQLLLSGEFEVGYDNPGCIMALLLAVDDRIVHVIYWDSPDAGGHHRVVDMRRFDLRNDLLQTIADNQPCPVYVVLAPTDDFFGSLDEYRKRPQEYPRLRIGHIRRWTDAE